MLWYVKCLLKVFSRSDHNIHRFFLKNHKHKIKNENVRLPLTLLPIIQTPTTQGPSLNNSEYQFCARHCAVYFGETHLL